MYVSNFSNALELNAIDMRVISTGYKFYYNFHLNCSRIKKTREIAVANVLIANSAK